MNPISIPSTANPPNCSVKKIRFQEELDQKEPNSDLDERIWCRFPEDLMARVLSYLPISIIFRSTLLCKSWKSIISSPLFQTLNSQIPPNSHNPWFFIFHREFSHFCLAYDPCLNRWTNLSFRFLPLLFRPIAAGHGLVCLLCKTPSGLSLSLCNPISNSCTDIPTSISLFRYFHIVSGLFFDRINGFFRLVLVGSNPISDGLGQFVLSAEVYDSETELWVRIKSFPVSSPVSPWRAISNGILYCVLGRSPMSIIAFNVKIKGWFMVEAPLPHSLTAIRLMDRNDRLVMIGGVGMAGITEEIGIWELDESGREWKVIGWIQKEICNFFLQSLRRRFACTGHGDLIYFTSKRCPYVAMYVISSNCMKFLDPSPWLLDPHYHNSRTLTITILVVFVSNLDSDLVFEFFDI